MSPNIKYKILLGTFLWHTLYLKAWVRGADEIKKHQENIKNRRIAGFKTNNFHAYVGRLCIILIPSFS